MVSSVIRFLEKSTYRPAASMVKRDARWGSSANNWRKSVLAIVDAWSVKFHHDDVAAGHPLRGRTLLLLRRIYSDRMAPIDGYPIDVPGAIPPGYAVGEIASFEKRLWEHFWEIATDPRLASAMGVRVAQGEAVYKPLRVGQVYELIVDAAGGMSLLPLPADDGTQSPDRS